MSTKTIYINGRFLTQKLTGVQRFALETVLALDSLADQYPQYHFVLVTPPNTKDVPKFSNIEHQAIGKRSGMLWELIDLPHYVGRDFLINLGNTAPLTKTHQMVVVHDLAVYSYPQNFNFTFRLWYRTLYFVLKSIGVKFATVSMFSQSEIHGFLNIPLDKITVLTEGKEHLDSIEPDNTILDKLSINSTPFVLAVGSVKPNKNFGIIAKLIQQHSFDGVKFVIAGGFNPELFKDIETLPDSIVQAGYVTDEELKALYQHAACFLFPSLYEGFGIPPLEAMTNGCPVICANTSSIPEVCGDAVLYFEPNDIHQLKEHLDTVLSSSEARQTLVEKGIARANTFSWKNNAKLLVEKCLNAFT